MKKIFFVLCAVLSLSACNKDLVEGQDRENGFSFYQENKTQNNFDNRVHFGLDYVVEEAPGRVLFLEINRNGVAEPTIIWGGSGYKVIRNRIKDDMHTIELELLDDDVFIDIDLETDRPSFTRIVDFEARVSGDEKTLTEHFEL